MSYLLDTNVLSELRRKTPEAVKWMLQTRETHKFCSVITLGEIAKGIEGRRQADPAFVQKLMLWLENVRAEYSERTLPVTSDIALLWGRIAAGRTRDTADALIAATAITHDLTLVTRNTRDFEDLAIRLVNPWQA